MPFFNVLDDYIKKQIQEVRADILAGERRMDEDIQRLSCRLDAERFERADAIGDIKQAVGFSRKEVPLPPEVTANPESRWLGEEDEIPTSARLREEIARLTAQVSYANEGIQTPDMKSLSSDNRLKELEALCWDTSAMAARQAEATIGLGVRLDVLEQQIVQRFPLVPPNESTIVDADPASLDAIETATADFGEHLASPTSAPFSPGIRAAKAAASAAGLLTRIAAWPTPRTGHSEGPTMPNSTLTTARGQPAADSAVRGEIDAQVHAAVAELKANLMVEVQNSLEASKLHTADVESALRAEFVRVRRFVWMQLEASNNENVVLRKPKELVKSESARSFMRSIDETAEDEQPFEKEMELVRNMVRDGEAARDANLQPYSATGGRSERIQRSRSQPLFASSDLPLANGIALGPHSSLASSHAPKSPAQTSRALIAGSVVVACAGPDGVRTMPVATPVRRRCTSPVMPPVILKSPPASPPVTSRLLASPAPSPQVTSRVLRAQHAPTRMFSTGHLPTPGAQGSVPLLSGSASFQYSVSNTFLGSLPNRTGGSPAVQIINS